MVFVGLDNINKMFNLPNVQILSRESLPRFSIYLITQFILFSIINYLFTKEKNFDKLLLSSLKLLFVKFIVNTIMIIISYSLIWFEFGASYEMGSKAITLTTFFGIIKKIIETFLFLVIYNFINSIGSENKFSFGNIISNLFNNNLYTLIYLI